MFMVLFTFFSLFINIFMVLINIKPPDFKFYKNKAIQGCIYTKELLVYYHM